MTPINDQDLELLSAYLDDELGASQRSALETRLTTDPALAAALEELQQTVRILRATPRLAVPRNFTLDPARYTRPVPWWMRYGVMQLVGAVGAAASVMIIAAGVYLSGMSFAAAPTSGGNAVAQSGAASNVSNAGVPVEATQTQIAAGRNSFSPTETALSTMLPTQTALMKSSTEAQPPNPMAAVAESAAEEPSITTTMTATGTMEFYSTQSKDVETALQPSAPGGDLDIPSGGVGMTDAAGSAGEQDGAGGAFAGDPNALPPSQDQPGAADNAPVLVATVEETPTVLPATFPPATALAAYDATRDDAFAEKTVPVEGSTAVANFSDENVPADKVDDQLGQDATTNNLNRQDAAVTPVSQFILIAGIALLVFSVMLFLLGWLRTRQRM